MKKFLCILLCLVSCFSQAGSLPVAKMAPFFKKKTGATGGGGGGGGPALVFQTIKYGTPSGCTTAPATNTTAATFFVLATRGYRSPYPLPSATSPSQSSYPMAGIGYGSGGAGTAIYYTNSPATGSAQTFAADGGDTGSTAYSAIAAFGLTGISSFVGSSSNAVTASSIQANASVSAKVHFSTLSVGNDATAVYTFSVDSGFTIAGQGDAVDGSGNTYHFVVAYKVSNSATTEQPTFTETAGPANPSLTIYHSGFN